MASTVKRITEELSELIGWEFTVPIDESMEDKITELAKLIRQAQLDKPKDEVDLEDDKDKDFWKAAYPEQDGGNLFDSIDSDDDDDE